MSHKKLQFAGASSDGGVNIPVLPGYDIFLKEVFVSCVPVATVTEPATVTIGPLEDSNTDSSDTMPASFTASFMPSVTTVINLPLKFGGDGLKANSSIATNPFKIALAGDSDVVNGGATVNVWGYYISR